jgi:Ca-activated chloride channel family protein
MLTPLTFDHKTVRHQLDETFIGMAGPRTAMGDAMGLGIKRLMDQPSDSRVMVLLTDGHYNIGELNPITAARIAAEYGLKIYTIGFEPEEVVVRGPFGQRMMARSDLHEPELIKIAEITGAEYFRATNTDSLRRIYDALDKLEPIETDPEMYRPVRSLFYAPLAIAFCLSLLLALQALMQGRWQANPMSPDTAARPDAASDA